MGMAVMHPFSLAEDYFILRINHNVNVILLMNISLCHANKGRWPSSTNRPPRDHVLGTLRIKSSRESAGPLLSILPGAADRGLPEPCLRLQERGRKHGGAFTLQD